MFISHAFFNVPDSELHMRKKQRQSERLNNLMNKYKLTAEKEKKQQQQQQQQVIKNNSNKPVRLPQDKYTFTPEDFKYENKHYKYIRYTKYNKVSGVLGWWVVVMQSATPCVFVVLRDRFDFNLTCIAIVNV
jgi:hypothetical protein